MHFIESCVVMKINAISFYIRKYFVVLTSLIIGFSILGGFDRSLILDVFFSVCFVLMPFPAIVESLCFLLPLVSTFEFAHVFLVALVLLILKRRTINLKRFAAILAVLFLEMLTYIIYDKNRFNWMLGYLLIITLVIYLSYEQKILVKKDICIKMYIIGIGTFFFMYLLSAFMQHGSSFLVKLFQGTQRFGQTADGYFSGMAININANYLAYYSVCGMASIITLLKTTYLADKEKIIIQGLFAFITLIGAMTLSRSWIVAVIIIFFFYSLANNGNLIKTFYRFAVISILGILVIAFLAQTTSIINSFIQRFSGESIATAGNRTTTISEYLGIFFKTDIFMMFGTGVTDYTELIISRYSIHNALVQILICCGIPGTILMIAVLYMPMIKAFCKNVRLIYWLPAIAVFAFSQTIQFLNPPILILPHLIGVFALQMEKQSL